MQDLSIVTTSHEHPIGTNETSGNSSLVPDWLGVVASVACAIHCAAMPFVIAFLPMLGLSFLADASFHKVMVVVCTALALLAFVPGWRVHRKWLPAGIAVAGLVIIGAAAFGLEDSCACCTLPEDAQTVAVAGETEAAVCTDACCEHCAAEAAASSNKDEPTETTTEETAVMAGFVPWITPIGGILLVVAHLVNRRLSCTCGCCPAKPSEA